VVKTVLRTRTSSITSRYVRALARPFVVVVVLIAEAFCFLVNVPDAPGLSTS